MFHEAGGARYGGDSGRYSHNFPQSYRSEGKYGEVSRDRNETLADFHKATRPGPSHSGNFMGSGEDSKFYSGFGKKNFQSDGAFNTSNHNSRFGTGLPERGSFDTNPSKQKTWEDGGSFKAPPLYSRRLTDSSNPKGFSGISNESNASTQFNQRSKNEKDLKITSSLSAPNAEYFSGSSKSNTSPSKNYSGSFADKKQSDFPRRNTRDLLPKTNYKNSFPEGNYGTSCPENRYGHSYPEKHYSDSFPEKDNSASFSQKTNCHLYPKKDYIDAFPERNYSGSFPEKKGSDSLMEKNYSGPFTEKKYRESFPERNYSGSFPEKKGSDSLIEKNYSGPFTEKNYRESFPERNYSGSFPEKKGSDSLREKNYSGPFTEKNDRESFPERNYSGSFPEKKGSDSLMKKNSSGPFTEENYREHFPERNYSGSFPEKKGSDSLIEKKHCGPFPEKTYIDSFGERNYRDRFPSNYEPPLSDVKSVFPNREPHNRAVGNDGCYYGSRSPSERERRRLPEDSRYTEGSSSAPIRFPAGERPNLPSEDQASLPRRHYDYLQTDRVSGTQDRDFFNHRTDYSKERDYRRNDKFDTPQHEVNYSPSTYDRTEMYERDLRDRFNYYSEKSANNQEYENFAMKGNQMFASGFDERVYTRENTREQYCEEESGPVPKRGRYRLQPGEMSPPSLGRDWPAHSSASREWDDEQYYRNAYPEDHNDTFWRQNDRSNEFYQGNDITGEVCPQRETDSPRLSLNPKNINMEKSPKDVDIIIRQQIPVAIVNLKFPLETLTRAEAQEIQNLIIEKINNLDPESAIHPRFSAHGYRGGALEVVCLDSKTLNWLTHVVRKLCLSNGQKLTVKPHKVIKSSAIIGGFFPSQNISEEKFMQHIADHNSNIDTSRWVILQKTITTDGTYVSIGTPKGIDEQLAAVNHMLNFNLSRVKITVLSKSDSCRKPLNLAIRNLTENLAKNKTE